MYTALMPLMLSVASMQSMSPLMPALTRGTSVSKQVMFVLLAWTLPAQSVTET